MLALESVSKAFGTQVILQEQTWNLPRGVVGLVGVNGAGKTTFLRLVAGEDDLDAGRIIAAKGTSIGYLPQELGHSEREGTLIDTILQGRRDLLEMETKIEDLAGDLGDPKKAAAYADLQEQFESEGGYVFRSRAREIAFGLGFANEDFERSITEFSGGWQMRGLLGRLLLSEPTVLLLDEPTNHLDLETVAWLERQIAAYEGCVLIVSHDRYFLNRMVTHVAELHAGRIKVYRGTYDEFTRARDEEVIRLRAAATRQAKEIERVERFIDRFRYKSTKAVQVQSRIKQLDKVERIEVPDEVATGMAFSFPQPPRMGKIVVSTKKMSFGYPDSDLLYEGLNLEINRGDKVALVGPNGAGKTTLLKLFAQTLFPTGGEVELGHNVEFSYFAQHALEQLDATNSVLQEVASAASIEVSGTVRDVLGAFGYSGDDVQKRISVLSGGEKNRVALAKLMMAPGGLLLLDEPTNHLDILSRQVLEDALKSFTGAIIMVSHDRHFINEVANKIIHVEDGQLHTYKGDWAYYEDKHAEDMAKQLSGSQEATSASAQPDATSTNSKKALRKAAAERRAEIGAATKELRKRVETLETLIDDLEGRKRLLLEALATPEVYSAPEVSAQTNRELKTVEAELEIVLEDWETAGAQLDEVEAQFAAAD